MPTRSTTPGAPDDGRRSGGRPRPADLGGARPAPRPRPPRRATTKKRRGTSARGSPQTSTTGRSSARRLLLAHGQWLRRQRRIADSRAPLRTARDTFDALGCAAWGDRARRELRASGESSRRRDPEARDQLTAQELQIAQLAAEGLTNREIGQRLYLSHRTIATHLYRVFPEARHHRTHRTDRSARGGNRPAFVTRRATRLPPREVNASSIADSSWVRASETSSSKP